MFSRAAPNGLALTIAAVTVPDSATLATLAIAVVTVFLVLVTGGVVLATLGLVAATFYQGHLTRTSLDLSIRPLLADPRPDLGAPPDVVLFGAPGRQSFNVAVGVLWMNGDGSQISLPFRNVGAGVAVITSATTEPDVTGEVNVSRKFVPVGEHVRVNVSRMSAKGDAARVGPGWAYPGFALLIHYTDVSGGQPLISRAEFRQYATQGPFVETISIFKAHEPKPFVVSRSTG